MTNEIKKSNQSPWIILFKNYYVWFAFSAVLFILTNAFSTLDSNRIRFNMVDIILTYGFLLFLSMFEVVVFALVFVCLHLGIQRVFRIDPSAVFRMLLLAWFGLSWLNLFLAFFKHSLF